MKTLTETNLLSGIRLHVALSETFHDTGQLVLFVCYPCANHDGEADIAFGGICSVCLSVCLCIN